jgi:beta-phosphoglucomutase
VIGFCYNERIGDYMKAIIFDLDGVIVSTDHLHYLSWKKIADQFNIVFDETMNHSMRGISRRESLEILFKQYSKVLTEDEKLALMEEKNTYYKTLLASLSKDDILPSILDIIALSKQKHIKNAIGSSSKNAQYILEKIGLINHFDVIVDGNQILNSKPDPEVFLKACSQLGFTSNECVVVEDAHAGILAARRAGMKAYAVGDAISSELKDGLLEDLIHDLNLM